MESRRYTPWRELKIDLKTQLTEEIDALKVALDSIQKGERKSVDVSENKQRISDVLKRISDNTLRPLRMGVDPIYSLLRVAPLTRTEIPLEDLEMLASAGFFLDYQHSYKSYLDIAVDYHHFNTLHFLVHHGAKSCTSYAMAVLASQPNVPLDLFDLLATPENLNGDRTKTKTHNLSLEPDRLPLHNALSCGHTKTALHLIKLGARVDQQDSVSLFPVDCYVQNIAEQHSSIPNKDSCEETKELLVSLIPSNGVNILRPICFMLNRMRPHRTTGHSLEMLHQLIQRLKFDRPLKLEIGYSPYSIYGIWYMEVNDLRLYVSRLLAATSTRHFILFICVVLFYRNYSSTWPQYQVQQQHFVKS